jgi:hypothetical protein
VKLALNCYAPSTPTGLGTLCRALWKLLPFDVLLAARHKNFGCELPYENGRTVLEMGSEGTTSQALGQLEMDCIVAVERCMPGNLFRAAHKAGMRTVLIVMHEWLNTDCEWLPDTDLFVCPNAISERKCLRLGILQERVRRCCLPLDLESLPFTLRTCAVRFVFSNGWGGVHDRKGWPEMRQALEMMEPKERQQVTICSQKMVGPVGGASFRTDVPSVEDRYANCDVAVVPSRTEGLGLAILEPLALGLPVLTTTAEPMCRYLEAAYGDLARRCLLPLSCQREVSIWGHSVWSNICSPAEIVDAVRAARDWPADVVQELSRRGRQYIEAEWGVTAGEKLLEAVRG